MTRTPEQVAAELATIAGLTPFDPLHTWRDVLVGPDGTWSRPADPDRALLVAAAEEHAAVDAHVATRADALHTEWLERLLAVPRLPVVADQVVARVTPEKGAAPVTVPVGTVLRGGKDAAGAERRYATLDPLTVHGATVTAVRSLVPGGTAPGLPGLVATADDVAGFPLDPAGGTDAEHRLRLTSPVLAFDGGDMTVRVAFTGAASASGLAGARWRWPLPDGTVGEVSGTVSGNAVLVPLTTGCAAGGAEWLDCVLPATVALPTGLAFSDVTLAVTSRTPLVPQAASLNDGLLDVSKEFQPFGPAAQRGDALYLRSDEAFSKPLKALTVTVTVMSGGAPLSSSAGGGGSFTGWTQHQYQAQAEILSDYFIGADAAASAAWAEINDLATWTPVATVAWQYRDGREWHDLATVSNTFAGFSVTDAGGAVSEVATVGGQTGRFIRAFLSEGDFGWRAYLDALAQFATDAVQGTGTMPAAPVPPIVSSITIGYTTRPVSATRIEATNGWATTTRTSGVFHPFTRTVSETGDTGMVAIGLELGARAADVAGQSVSVHLTVDSASPCGSAADPDARWQWWDGTSWHDLGVADGTRLLRESGLLRFIAPAGWAVGCTDTGATTGCWVRMVTTAPERIGVIGSATPDAVVAAYVSQAADPQTDPTPATPLAPGAIKGTLTPVPGVAKVTNLSSTKGRGPEDDVAYRGRASGVARHRGRAVAAWDYAELVRVAFPEVLDVLTLPHTGVSGERVPGSVGLVLLPDRPEDPSPRPSVSLAGRVVDTLAPAVPLHASPVVLCASYVPATVVAQVQLARGISALGGLAAITAALETWLHPGTTLPVRWGRSLYASSLEAYLAGLPEVGALLTFELRGADGLPAEVLTVDPCRGLYCSSGGHELDVQEAL